MLSVLSQSSLIDLRFCDEAAFNLTSNIPYGWTPIGQQQEVPAAKGGKLNVFGLLNIHSGALNSYLSTATVNSAQVIEWLNDFAQVVTKTTVLVLDNAPWHKSAQVAQQLETWQAKGLYLYFLPPYSPHLNYIEILWRVMKYQWLRPADFGSKAELHERIRTILGRYGEPEFSITFTS